MNIMWLLQRINKNKQSFITWKWEWIMSFKIKVRGGNR